MIYAREDEKIALKINSFVK